VLEALGWFVVSFGTVMSAELAGANVIAKSTMINRTMKLSGGDFIDSYSVK